LHSDFVFNDTSYYKTVMYFKVARVSSITETRSGKQKAIFINSTPLECTQSLWTQKPFNKRYDNSKRTWWLCKTSSEYKQIARLWVTFSCTFLYYRVSML